MHIILVLVLNIENSILPTKFLPTKDSSGPIKAYCYLYFITSFLDGDFVAANNIFFENFVFRTVAYPTALCQGYILRCNEILLQHLDSPQKCRPALRKWERHIIIGGACCQSWQIKKGCEF